MWSSHLVCDADAVVSFSQPIGVELISSLLFVLFVYFLYLFFFHVLFVLFLFPILLGVYYFTWCKHKILLFFFGVWLIEFLIYVACDSYLLECEIKRVQLTLLPTLYYQKWQPSSETINNSKSNFFFLKKKKRTRSTANKS